MHELNQSSCARNLWHPALLQQGVTESGLGWAGAGIITDTMLTAASEALPALIPARSKERGCVYPPLDDIR